MGEYWADVAVKGYFNIFGWLFIFIELEGEYVVVVVIVGLFMIGFCVVNFFFGQGIVYMYEFFYVVVGKCLIYVLNIGVWVMIKFIFNVYVGYDDYYVVDDIGFFQLFVKKVQYVVDFNIIVYCIVELVFILGIVVQDGFLIIYFIEFMMFFECEFIKEYFGWLDDIIKMLIEV